MHDPRDSCADPTAFEAFYREHVEAIGRFVARRVDDPHRAADLTADVFVTAIESAGAYRPERGSPIAWLFGVAHHVLAADRRTRGRELRATGRLSGRRLLDEDDVVRLEERIDAETAARELYGAMDRLTEGERAVLELTALDGLGVADAARALGLAQTTARVRLHRARRKLRAYLSPPDATNLRGPHPPAAVPRPEEVVTQP